MSRSKNSSKGCKALRSREFSSARLPGYPQANGVSKRLTHRKERVAVKEELRAAVVEMDRSIDEDAKEIVRLIDGD